MGTHAAEIQPDRLKRIALELLIGALKDVTKKNYRKHALGWLEGHDAPDKIFSYRWALAQLGLKMAVVNKGVALLKDGLSMNEMRLALGGKIQ